MKFTMKKNDSGFSLVELMVVVGIIGILASLALPKLQVFMAKSKQSEAKVILPVVYSLEQSYFADNNAFTNDLTDIGLNVAPKYFNVPGITANSATAFTASMTAATGRLCSGSTAESWTIDEAKALKQNNSATFKAPVCN